MIQNNKYQNHTRLKIIYAKTNRVLPLYLASGWAKSYPEWFCLASLWKARRLGTLPASSRRLFHQVAEQPPKRPSPVPGWTCVRPMDPTNCPLTPFSLPPPHVFVENGQGQVVALAAWPPPQFNDFNPVTENKCICENFQKTTCLKGILVNSF